VEQSNLILEKAMQYHPKVWKFPFFLGFNYWFHSNNSSKAASYIKIAAELPGAPKYLKTFPARLYSAAGANDAALSFLTEMLHNTQEPKMRAKLEKRIRELSQGELKAPVKPKHRINRH
jgi:hypothetical protein